MPTREVMALCPKIAKIDMSRKWNQKAKITQKRWHFSKRLLYKLAAKSSSGADAD